MGVEMSVRTGLAMWAGVAVLAAATVVTGAVAGYRADEASVIRDGEAALAVPQWSAALWILVAATALAGALALAATVRQARGAGARGLAAPAAVTAAGLVGAVLFLPIAALGAAGLAWLAVRAFRVPSPREGLAQATAG